LKGKRTLSGALLFAVSVAAFGQQSSSTLASASRYECTTACAATDPSPYCMVAPRDAKLASALSQLRQRLGNPTPSQLSSADLMRFFDVKDDPCTRGDTLHESGVWANKGAACLLSVNVDVFPGASKVPIRIHIPSELLFTATQRADWLKITPRRTATVLEIADANLHHDWGGTIQGVYANASSALFQLPRGCIKIPL
jgi:hypothetical protein